MALVGKNLPVQAGDIRHMGSIPGSGRSLGEGHGNPLQYFVPEESHGQRSLWATVHRVAKSGTLLSDWHTHTHTQDNIKNEV